MYVYMYIYVYLSYYFLLQYVIMYDCFVRKSTRMRAERTVLDLRKNLVAFFSSLSHVEENASRLRCTAWRHTMELSDIADQRRPISRLLSPPLTDAMSQRYSSIECKLAINTNLQPTTTSLIKSSRCWRYLGHANLVHMLSTSIW